MFCLVTKTSPQNDYRNRINNVTVIMLTINLYLIDLNYFLQINVIYFIIIVIILRLLGERIYFAGYEY